MDIKPYLHNCVWLLISCALLTACTRPTPSVLPADSPLATPSVALTDLSQSNLETSPSISPVASEVALTSQPASSGEFPLATPYSEEPAAGICLEVEGKIASVEIYPDIPSPRCLKVSSDQKLMVINRTTVRLQLALGNFEYSLPPGEEYTFDTAFGEYLAPGVHHLSATPHSGPEIWLVPAE